MYASFPSAVPCGIRGGFVVLVFYEVFPAGTQFGSDWDAFFVS